MLYIVPTPIGNLEDITLRALNVLKAVDLILAEDTRNTLFLLKHYNISKPVRPNHQHNEHKILEDLIQQLKAGKSIAIVSDAGTPGISDPGFLLIRACVQSGIPLTTLPGATAFVPALVNSGLPCDSFTFVGFLPHKKGRQTRLTQLANEPRTLIFYESPFRLLKALEEFKKFFGADRRASVSRELSKLYEENKQGTIDELIKYFTERPAKGEIVIVVEGASHKKQDDE
ncbi:MAG: 16S rRNA (cytidine(1402)-2'-O)-methyltransferase [Sediminibacterium sp.]|nr:16S rRNA (cytidine(1402)-2'-O)-methyltransferase [Sediminibacterium sp.]